MSGINILKEIRTARNLSANHFAVKLMISAVYLSLIENNKKKLSLRIVERVVELFPDLSDDEKLRLENEVYFDVQETQKFIMSLAQDFFSNLKKEQNVENAEKAKEDFKKLQMALGKLAKFDWTDELVMLKA